MRTAICTKYGSPDFVIIENRQKPTPKNNEILIRIHASTVSSGDCRVRGANTPSYYKPMIWLIFGIGKPRKSILGTELSGQIETVGKNVTKFKQGDSVFAMTGMKMGAHAEYITLSENGKIAQKPNNISYEHAAAIAFGGTTALHFFRKGNLQKNHKILIYGASGAVGTSAVQIAKHFGAEVTGVCSKTNMGLVKSLGADYVIDYASENFRNKNVRYDVIFDAVGKITKSSCKNVLAAGGKYVSVNKGFASERIEDMQLLGELVQTGKLVPVIDKLYTLEQIVDAYNYADTGHKRGNIVIKIL